MLFSSKTEDEIDHYLNNGTSVNFQDLMFGYTYLHVLVMSNSSLLRYFLTKLPNTNLKNVVGRTPLYYACNKETVELLMSYGASPLVKDNEGKTPMDINKIVKEHVLEKMRKM